MIRKWLFVLFNLCITCSYAQVKYQKCTVYSTGPRYGSDSFITEVLFYNKYGKITEECIYRKIEEGEDGTGNTSQLAEIILYTYTGDTLLSLKKAIYLANEDMRIDDTAVVAYSYDANNKITSIISASYGRGGTGCLVGIEGTRWYDSTKTVYTYDDKGNLIKEATSELSFSMPGFTMGGFQPNFAAYRYDDKNRISSINHLYIEVLTYNGAELVKEEGITDTIEVATEVYGYYNKCRVIELVTQTSDRVPPDISFTFYNQSGNITQEYIHDNYITGGYGYPVERFYTYQPDKRLVKEIHYDNSGNIEQVDSYIYE